MRLSTANVYMMCRAQNKRRIYATSVSYCGFSLFFRHSPINMSTAMNFGSKSFQPRAPDKGSFPLDHLGKSIKVRQLKRQKKKQLGC